MKIAYIMSGTGLHGGATKSLLNVLRCLSSEGHEAIIICPDKSGIYEYILTGHVPRVKAIHIDFTYDILPFLKNAKDYLLFIPRLFKRKIKNYRAANKLAKVCKQETVDIIHTNTSVNDIGFKAAKKLGVPHIWHIREYGKLDFNMIVPYQRKMFLSPFNYTVSITKDIARYKKLPITKDNIVVYNGVCESNKCRISDSDDNYFLYAGNVSAKKGIFDLLEAYTSYLQSTSPEKKIVKLHIAGGYTSDIKEKIDLLCKINNISQYVEILGPRDDIADLMFRAKAVIIPSYFEGFGRVMPEAMSNGSVTIGRNTGGTKEQFDNGVSLIGREIGFRFNTINELVSILIDVASKDKSLFIEMIRNSQEVVKKLYSNEVSASNIINLYNKILNEDNH